MSLDQFLNFNNHNKIEVRLLTTIKTKKSFLNYSHTIGICVMDGRGFMFPVDTAIGKNGRLHTVSRAYTQQYFSCELLCMISTVIFMGYMVAMEKI